MAKTKIANVAAAKKTAEKKAKIPAAAPAPEPVDTSALTLFSVLRPIHHGPTPYAPGELIELDETDSDHLLKTRAIEPFVDDEEIAAEAAQ